MSLKHALLGYLTYRDLTGYELKQYFDTSVQHFWPVNLSQIYPTLGRMEEEGLVTMQLQYQEGRPNRKVYHITEDGRAELRHWLVEPMDLQPVREPFLIKVFFGAGLAKEEILAQLRGRLELLRARLADYEGPVREGMERRIGETGLERDGLYWGLTLECGVKGTEACIAWLEEAIGKIEGLDETGPKDLTTDN